MQCIVNIVIFITEWDPPVVGKCNLKGSLQSARGFYLSGSFFQVGRNSGICWNPSGILEYAVGESG